MGKVITLRSLLKELPKTRRGRKVVFTNGCFDILHAGHVRYLKKARSLGGMLIVGMNSDSSVKSIKGDRRPIVPGKERGEVLSALACVGYVVPFNETTPLKLIEAMRPDILAKGADWAARDIVGGEFVKRNGGGGGGRNFFKGRWPTNTKRRGAE